MNSVTKAVKHSAAGQYLGYALQPVRLCFHLLTAPDGASVSLEYLDDVALHLADGRIILEQSKSALKHNPLSDWATDLWKTLANWLDLLATGKIDADTTEYRLYVTPVKSGDLASMLHQAKTDDDVAIVLARIEERLGKLEMPPLCGDNVNKFLHADTALRAAFVKNLTIISEDADPLDAVRAIFKLTVSPPIVDLICERAIGAAKEAADRLIRAGKPALLSADAFRLEQRAFIQRNNLPGLLTSFAEKPSEKEVQQMMTNHPAFLRQLELVEVETEACLRAVSDYLRTLADISIWGDSGLIFEKNINDWDDDLVSRHAHIAAEVHDVHGNQAKSTRGRIIYRRCAQLQPPLDGRVVPGHFVHGSYNALADRLCLGWHPDFKALLESVA